MAKAIALVSVAGLLFLSACSSTITVAADGSARFSSVQAAINSLHPGTKWATIHVKPGTYTEHITVGYNEPPIRIYGDDAAATVLVFNLQHNTPGPDGIPIGTARSASVTIRSADFEADDLTFANSTPPNSSQAVALAAEGDRDVFRRCRFVGLVDTLFTNGGAPPLTPGDTRPSIPGTHGPATTVSPTAQWTNRLYFE